MMFPISQLKPNPLNPRREIIEADVRELAENIAAVGILQPLLITPDGTVIFGHRRLAAAHLAGLAEVPVTVRDASPVEQLELMMTENIHRNNLTPIEEARGFQHLLDTGLAGYDVMRALGITKHRFESRIALLALTTDVQELFDGDALPLAAAPVLARITDVDKQKRFAILAARRRLSIPQLEAALRRDGKPKEKPGRKKRLPPVKGTLNGLIVKLGGKSGHGLFWVDLATTISETCADCDMARSATICAACPLYSLLARLANMEERCLSGGQRIA